MAVDEGTRDLVYRALAPVVGEEAAAVVSRELPASELATREQVDRWFEQVDRRFEVLEARMEGPVRGPGGAHGCDARRGPRRVPGELVTAVVGQTRTVIFALVGTIAAMGGLALSLARFS